MKNGIDLRLTLQCIIRYVKHLDTAKPPWLHDSELNVLAIQFEEWRATLPMSMRFSPAAIYTRKESSQLGGLTLLWCTYHQTLCDLYRIGMPKLFKIRKAVEFPPEQREFLEHCQKTCFEQAQNISITISEALRHGIEMLADTWMCIIAHDCTKVMLHYLTELTDLETESGKLLMKETFPLFRRNIHALKLMIPMIAAAEHCVCLSTILVE